ncbi:MAG: CDP-alcohol phosphatidyltransferase family protein [Gammaproteobacteria bacterium]|nr:CDP-alcohol phosphatidyltransferase family protein [Gammaproteobacteria bacterium]
MANLLTAIRLLLALPVAISMAHAGFLSPGVVLLLLIFATASDYFDGKVARAKGTASPKGMLFDHGTDFLFVTSGLAGAAWAGLLHWILPVLIFIAFSQYVLDSYFLFRHKQLRMSFLGRWNGILYFVPLFGISLARLIPDELPGDILLVLVEALSVALILSTLVSIIDRSIAPFRKAQKG